MSEYLIDLPNQQGFSAGFSWLILSEFPPCKGLAVCGEDPYMGKVGQLILYWHFTETYTKLEKIHNTNL